jgi:hypothetical protein
MVTAGFNEPVHERIHLVATASENDSSECSIKNVQPEKQENPEKESISIPIDIPPPFLIRLAPESAPATNNGVPTQNGGRYFPAIWKGSALHQFKIPK